jgi:ubiquinone/menaquinone biosynthesis C-methylase UbiE
LSIKPVFLFSEDSSYSIELRDWAAGSQGAFWHDSVHTKPGRRGLVVLAGCTAVFARTAIQAGDTGFITVGAALPEISSDGLDVLVRFRTDSGEEIPLLTERILSYDDANPWVDFELDLKACYGKSGSLAVECGVGPEGDPCADWLIVYECVVSAPEQRGLERARAFKEYRAKNEVAHFSFVDSIPAGGNGKEGFWERLTGVGNRSISLSPPGAQRYAGDLLQKELKRPIPDFTALLKRRAGQLPKGAKLRVLSLCCGVADKEAVLMSRVDGSRVELTLMDLNAQLLEKAKDALSVYCDTQAAAVDVNALELERGRFDVILCAAGLHHLIELERVVDAIANGLSSEGEFWSIGEYIGRPGARLWPDAYQFANRFFAKLPEKYRVNWTDKENQPVDAQLSNFDCSVSTFEGIRSDQIEDCLNKRLVPHHVSRQACFLWRFFDGTYSRNYDLRQGEDVKVIRRAVLMDAEHQRAGGRPTSLNAVYRKRL